MVEVNIYSDIHDEMYGISSSQKGKPFPVFSAEKVRRLFKQHPHEKEFKFNINSNGGSVSEGLVIHDIIRTSGKTIYAHIEGGCHSIALLILLAAPKENRSANKNCRALIHKVQVCPDGYLDADALRLHAESVEQEQNAILDIYAERTGYDRSQLEILMKEERVRTAEELKEYGFISKINSYNTNLKNRQMSKKPNLGAANSVLAKIRNLLNPLVNYDFTDHDGNVLFTTSSEDDTLEVGMDASPDGSFALPDGRTVTIADGVITDIAEVADDDVAELENQVETLTNALKEAEKVITDLRNQVQSSYNVRGRTITTGKPHGQKSSSEKKNEAREGLALMRGGK